MIKKKILIVDDEIEMVELEVIRFEAHGYDVRATYDGESGIKMVRDWAPDLVILDIMLPGMDGYAVCEALKKDPQLKQTPIILVSAMDQKYDTARGLKAGADATFTKPFEPPLLLAKIKELIRPANTPKK